MKCEAFDDVARATDAVTKGRIERLRRNADKEAMQKPDFRDDARRGVNNCVGRLDLDGERRDDGSIIKLSNRGNYAARTFAQESRAARHGQKDALTGGGS